MGQLYVLLSGGKVFPGRGFDPLVRAAAVKGRIGLGWA